MGIIKEKASDTPTVQIVVLVEFMDGYQGDFKGTFNRLPQERLDELADPDAGYSNSEVVDEILVGVSGIAAGTPPQELPADEQLAWVKQQPECVNAAVAAFFSRMRPARYAGKTSKKQRSRG